MQRGFGALQGAAVAKYATANTSVTASTTLTAATGLSVPVVAGGIYVVQASLRMDCENAGLMKVAVHGTATGTGSFSYRFFDLDVNSFDSVSAGVAFQTSVTTVNTGGFSGNWLVDVAGSIAVSTSGNLQIYFAQNTSNAIATRVLTYSTFIVTKV